MKAVRPCGWNIRQGTRTKTGARASLAVEFLFIPSSIHAVETPVPVPNSKKFPLGLLAAKILSKEPVNGSEVNRSPPLKANFASFRPNFGNNLRRFEIFLLVHYLSVLC